MRLERYNLALFLIGALHLKPRNDRSPNAEPPAAFSVVIPETEARFPSSRSTTNWLEKSIRIAGLVPGNCAWGQK